MCMSRYGWIPGGGKGDEQKGACLGLNSQRGRRRDEQKGSCLGMGSGEGGEGCMSRHGFLEG